MAFVDVSRHFGKGHQATAAGTAGQATGNADADSVPVPLTDNLTLIMTRSSCFVKHLTEKSGTVRAAGSVPARIPGFPLPQYGNAYSTMRQQAYDRGGESLTHRPPSLFLFVPCSSE